jgi:hypothetical protein
MRIMTNSNDLHDGHIFLTYLWARRQGQALSSLDPLDSLWERYALLWLRCAAALDYNV